MSRDISRLLHDWEYDSENTVRLITTEEGRQVMQVRLPLGIEQYELDGRPDGFRPFGKESMLDVIQERLDEFINVHREDAGFTIDHDDFIQLQNEGLLYYYRYILLFQIGDYERTSRDTDHNLRLCTLVDKYSTIKEDRQSLLQYKPYILRLNALSKSMVYLNLDRKAEATSVLENTINQIGSMPEVDTPLFQFERIRSLSQLKETLKRLKEHEVSPVEKLEEDLRKAVEEEDYEKAAELRDQISSLRGAQTE